jgi:hypothetical protein
MDERRDPPPPPEGSPPNLIGDEEGLSPVQSARLRYVRHATRDCDRCRDIDRDRCGEGERLYRAWISECDDAYEKLAGETL